jgi:formylglycine-generating enzyme required for sulfatase activity
VDGVCCDTQCNGTCNACTVSAKKQGIDGQCGPIALGWDPGNECTNGACDGIGGCKLDLGQQCFTGSECLSGQCVDGVCCNNACAGTCMACNAGNGICKYVALNLDPQNECSNGACGGNGACKKDIGQTCATDGDCLSNACSSKGVCMGPSCSGLAETCGSTQKENCCASSVVVGGTYDRDRWGGYAATLSDFRLDRFEATVGRFRKFVAAYPGSKPIGGAGAHPLITNSGWNTAWNLPGNQADLIGSVKGCTTPTWTDLADPTTDNRPINCVTWEVAFAFCAWDGGRLPTAAEWGFAATGGNSQAIYPWSTNATDCSSGYAVFNCQEVGNPIDCFLGDIRPVGWKPGGNSPGQQADMGGSMREWNLDYSGLPMPCNNCANLTNLGNSARVLRGGSWMSPYKVWNQQFGTQWVPEMDTLTQTTVAEARTIGLRCARTP